MKNCINCGNQLDDNIKFCPICGSKQSYTIIDKGDSEGNLTPMPEKDNNKKIIIISSIIGVAVLIIAAVIICLMFIMQDKKSVQKTTMTEATTTGATTTEATTTEELTTEGTVELENIAAKEAYYDFISDIVTGAVAYSSNTIACIDESDPYVYLIYDNYTIEDFDSDGVEELMVCSELNASPNGASDSYGENIYFYEYDANLVRAYIEKFT